MARPRARSVAREHRVRALVLRRVATGEADEVIALFTETLGRISAFTRSARRSQKRFGGALEPFHTIEVWLEERDGADLFILKEATLVRPRVEILSRLDAMDAAGRALGWVRRATAPRTAEPRLWQRLEQFLDHLKEPASSPKRALSGFGLGLLDLVGWGLMLSGCVVCGTECPPARSAEVDVSRGGVVCQRCGGGQLRLPAPLRHRLEAAAAGALDGLLEQDAEVARQVVELSLRTHAGVD